MNDFSIVPAGKASWPLSLHHLCALDASPAELVTLAAEAGCAHVCLFIYVPEAASRFYPVVAPADVPMLAERMRETGISLCNLEVFPLDGQENWLAFREGLKTGAALGATRATAHVHQPDFDTAVHRFAAFCDLAADHGIVAGLEFNGFSAVTDITTAAAIVRAAGRPNGELVCDTLHLIRSGGTPGDVAGVADLIGYAQISDGPATVAADRRWHEAVRERLLPGTGVFPLTDTIRALRPSTVIEVEVPQGGARKAGIGPGERTRRAAHAARAVLARAWQTEASA